MPSSKSSRPLPTGWRTVRFDQIAENVVERVDPAEADSDYYVGLEHLDPESLKLRRWGTPDDVIGEKLGFHAGDVIYGRRRAYQRKLAVAEFDGICSAHAMVLRARPEMMLQTFLPFFLQSETFHQRALAISVGSLSPTINWRTLARQEFAIPPLDEQRRIAKILWAADEATERMRDCILAQSSLKTALMKDLFSFDGIRTVSLDSVGSWISGGTPNKSREDFWNGDIPWASPKDMKEDVLYDTQEHVSEEGLANGSRLVPQDSIFVVVRGMILAHTFPIAMTGKSMAFNQDVKALIVSHEFNPRYIFYWLQSHANKILGVVSESSHGTKRVPTELLFEMQVPCPSREHQDKVVELLVQCDDAGNRLREHVNRLFELKKGLLATLLG